MTANQSFPALEELKAEAEGIDTLVAISPDGLASVLEWVSEVEYRERRRELLQRRDEVRESYQKGVNRIERTYGSSVVRTLERRDDGEDPRFDLERMQRELDDVKEALDDLYDDLDEPFLARHERRKLAALQTDIDDAREYLRILRVFRDRRAKSEPNIEEFEARFEPYTGCETYMPTSEYKTLLEMARGIDDQLADVARELTVHVLPETAVEWLSEKRTRFGDLVDHIPEYNERFVECEREAYADLFETEHGLLNNQQQKAIVRDDRRNLVDASAGTGKTLTLTYRFQYLLEKGVPVGEIAAITYTTDAAEEMKSRIAAGVDGVDESDLQISTIHALANRIVSDASDEEPPTNYKLGEARTRLVKDYLEAVRNGVSSADANVPNTERYRTFVEGYHRFTNNNDLQDYVKDHSRSRESREELIERKFEEFIEKARTFDRSVPDVRADLTETDALQAAFGHAGAALLGAYNEIVDSKPYPVDFDDMVRSATRIAESAPEKFGTRYQHLLVDEFQDTSDTILAFIESFITEPGETHLFCVGDDWQSIYGFNGSNVRHFTEYTDRFDDVTYTPLHCNYRCPPSIVDAGVELIEKSDAPQNEKDVYADSDVQTTPKLYEIDALYEDRLVPHVVSLVEEALDSGREFDDVMILSRNDAKSPQMNSIRDSLKRANIPHTRPNSQQDYLPDSFLDKLEGDVVFDNGDARFANADDMDAHRPPMVRVQSVHASKGTEAPVVILAHAVDDEPHGIPSQEREDKLLQPAMDLTARHIPEERRLFYVALTRAEEEFSAVAESGRVSRYIKDIEHRFERWRPPIVGTCTGVDRSDGPRDPIQATLDCGETEIDLLAWPNNDPGELEVGATYRISEPEISDNEFGVEVRFDESRVERLEWSNDVEGSPATPD